MNKISFGLYNQIDNRNEQYQKHIKAITNFSYNLLVELNGFKKEEIIEDIHLENILEEASNRNSDWIFLVAYGFVGFSPIMISELVNYAELNGYSILCHILDYNLNPYRKKLYYSLHEQCMLINVKDWVASGKPQYKKASHVVEQTMCAVIRSEDNIHDNYTPYWIKPTSEKITLTGDLPDGWGFIDGFCSNRFTIGNFPNHIREMKMHLYPDHGTELEQILNKDNFSIPKEEQQRKWLANTEVTKKANDVYIFNTCSIEKEDFRIKKVENLYSVGSGFKPLLLLNQCEWDDKTRVVYFDNSKKALNFKKWLLEHWDGEDYPSIANYYKETVDADVNFIWHYKNPDSYKEWQNIIAKFGSKADWLDFWNKYKKLEHHFLEIDLFENFDQLISDMKNNQGNNLIWFSNIFYSIISLRYFTPQELDSHYQNFYSQIVGNNKALQILGYDNEGTKVVDLIEN
jgi:hypothetical protein